MTTYDFDGYGEEVSFEPYNKFYTPAVEVCGTELLIGRNWNEHRGVSMETKGLWFLQWAKRLIWIF